MFVKSAYNYDGDVDSFKSGIDFSDSPSLAQQHFRDECDINVMVQRFQRTGVPDSPPVPPGVQDFSQVHDFQSAMQVIIESQSAFASLPSRLRERFGNDPSRYLEFVYDEANRDEAVKLGMIPAPPPPPPVNDSVDKSGGD